MKKIYPKEWMPLHPYKHPDSIDHYYVRIANLVYKELAASALGKAFPSDDDLRYTSLCLAAWFEDIISQTGIWEAFTAECKKRYGAYLPFYPIGEDYFTDEVNLEDVRFLLWHHVQYLRPKTIVNPENPGIEEAAACIYELLSEEYETAPENERMKQYLHQFTLKADDFLSYRELLEWFHYKCFFNIKNQDGVIEQMEDLMKQKDCDIPEEQLSVFLYSIRTESIFSGRLSPLSLTAPEWIERICKNHPEHDWLAQVKGREHSCYLLEKEDEDYLYVKDLCRNNEKLRITKLSLNMAQVRDLKPGTSLLLCSLVFYAGTWWQNGALIVNEYKERMKDVVKERKDEIEKSHEKEAFKYFMKASGGKHFVFLRTTEELYDFFTRKMKYNISEGLKLPEVKAPGMVLMASPLTGLHIQNDMVKCIKSPDSPFYDKAEAEEDAISFMANPNTVTYELSCLMQDQGMLADARLNSLKGPEYGCRFVQANARFLTDYYFNRCREKDLTTE